MHFPLIPILLATIVPITSSLPIAPRDANELLSTITSLNTAVGSLTTAVNNFDGSLLGLIPQAFAVVKAEATVDLTILKATHITKQSANFTAEESSSIVGSLAGGIGPIQASLDALKAKQPVFKKTLTAPIVLLDLKILKKHTGELIDALTAKVTPDVGGILGLGRGILDSAFDSAIAVYSA